MGAKIQVDVVLAEKGKIEKRIKNKKFKCQDNIIQLEIKQYFKN